MDLFEWSEFGLGCLVLIGWLVYVRIERAKQRRRDICVERGQDRDT